MSEEQFDAMKYFISDLISEISERKKEADKDMHEDSSDLFFSGRALAYNEVLEIIQNRLEIYGIEIEQQEKD